MLPTQQYDFEGTAWSMAQNVRDLMLLSKYMLHKVCKVKVNSSKHIGCAMTDLWRKTHGKHYLESVKRPSTTKTDKIAIAAYYGQ